MCTSTRLFSFSIGSKCKKASNLVQEPSLHANRITFGRTIKPHISLSTNLSIIKNINGTGTMSTQHSTSSWTMTSRIIVTAALRQLQQLSQPSMSTCNVFPHFTTWQLEFEAFKQKLKKQGRLKINLSRSFFLGPYSYLHQKQIATEMFPKLKVNLTRRSQYWTRVQHRRLWIQLSWVHLLLQSNCFQLKPAIIKFVRCQHTQKKDWGIKK